jgi:hypothetical protein
LTFNKIISRTTLAFAFGALLAALPATATTISFTTSANPTTVGPAGGASFTYVNANVGNFTSDTGVFFNAASGTTASTFGGFTYNASSAGSNVVSIKLNPTVNGGAQAALDFKGVVTSSVVGGQTAYSINFSSTTGANAGTGGLAGYTILTQNNVTYAIQTVQQLNVGKSTWIQGYVQGVVGVAPEPSTWATTGLALLLAGFVVRRQVKATN